MGSCKVEIQVYIRSMNITNNNMYEDTLECLKILTLRFESTFLKIL